MLLAAVTPVSAADERTALRAALTFHASFDHSFDADLAGGDRTLHFAGPRGAPPGPGEAIRRDPAGGRFGGALRFLRPGPVRPYFTAPGMLDYRERDWSGSVSLWLQVSPDEDLAPGYCDPVQLLQGDGSQGFIFLEWWSEGRGPKVFRYGVRPIRERWNPEDTPWEKLSVARRPMVQVTATPFTRERWTHVVFTFDRLNAGRAGRGMLYLDGEARGEVAGWDLTFGWDGRELKMYLGAGYAGGLDELAAFRRALTPAEVRTLHALPRGIADLR
ncbi:MAG: LamG-like jellyroll fold domain-containing protein [Opitutaceae bacterium]